MLRRILDAVEELLEVVVPHLEPETSQRGSTKDALSSRFSFLEDLDDLLLEEDRACPAAVPLPLESMDRWGVGPEGGRTGLPASNAHPCPHDPPMGREYKKNTRFTLFRDSVEWLD